MASDQSFKFDDLKTLVRGHLQHESETAWYVLVSMADFVLSYLLFSGGTAGGQSASEANPMAAWFLNHYGLIKVLLAYKVGLVVIVCLIVQLVSLKQPRMGRLLLWLGIAVTGYVVIYSARLLLGTY